MALTMIILSAYCVISGAVVAYWVTGSLLSGIIFLIIFFSAMWYMYQVDKDMNNG